MAQNYTTGGSGKSYVTNSASGNITVRQKDGSTKTYSPGQAGYAAARSAAQADTGGRAFSSGTGSSGTSGSVGSTNKSVSAGSTTTNKSSSSGMGSSVKSGIGNAIKEGISAVGQGLSNMMNNVSGSGGGSYPSQTSSAGTPSGGSSSAGYGGAFSSAHLINQNNYLQSQREEAIRTGNIGLLSWVNQQQSKLDDEARAFAWGQANNVGVTGAVDWHAAVYGTKGDDTDYIDMERDGEYLRQKWLEYSPTWTENRAGGSTSASGASSSASSRSAAAASDGRYYASGTNGRSYAFNPVNGNIAVTKNGVTTYVRPTDATYQATVAAVQSDTGWNLGALRNGGSGTVGSGGNLSTLPQEGYLPEEGAVREEGLLQDDVLTASEYQQMLDGLNAQMAEAIQSQDKALQAAVEAAILRLEQQKPQILQDMEDANRAAYLAYAQASDPYGALAESNAAIGLGNSGYAESAQVQLGNTYQNALNANEQTKSDALLELEAAKQQALLEGDIERAQAAADMAQQIAAQGIANANAVANYALSREQMAAQLAAQQWERDVYNQELELAQKESDYNRAMNLLQMGISSQWIAQQLGLDISVVQRLAAEASGESGESGGGSSSSSSARRKGSSGTVGSGNGSSSGAGVEESGDGLIVDTDSINALGYGPLTAAGLKSLIDSGDVVEYEEDGVLKFRRAVGNTTGNIFNSYNT